MEEGYSIAHAFSQLRNAHNSDPLLELAAMWKGSRKHQAIQSFGSCHVDELRDCGIVVCDCCGTVTHEDGSYNVIVSERFGVRRSLWCEDCTNEGANWSGPQEEWIATDVSVYFCDTEEYATYGWAEENAYSYDGEWYQYEQDRDEDGDGDDDSDDRLIKSRHYTAQHRVGYIPGHAATGRSPKLGLELEYEVDRNSSVKETAGRFLGNFSHDSEGYYFGFEEDGSLNRGFEVVTAYGPLDMHEMFLKDIEKPVEGLFPEAATTGLHVHIDRPPHMTNLHVVKLMRFMHSPHLSEIHHAVARRTSNYARGMPKGSAHVGLQTDLSPSNYGLAMQESRYEAISFDTRHYRTIEFRLFKGTQSFTHIMAAMEFTLAAVDYTRDTGLQQIEDPESFLSYLEHPSRRLMTRYLRKLLQEADLDIIFDSRELTHTLTDVFNQRKAA